MKSDLFSCKLPLFIPCDQDSCIQAIDIETQEITFPVSLSLLELLNSYTNTEPINSRIHLILDEIVKSPSFFFPEVPLLFERGGLALFVPDDNQYHKLNWQALILQFHISLLKDAGSQSISALNNRFSSNNKISNEETTQRNRYSFNAEENTRRMHEAGISVRDYATGSITMRQQSRCIASFSNRAMGSMGPSFESLQFSMVPPLQREENKNNFGSISQNGAGSNYDLTLQQGPPEVNQLFDFQILCSFENSPLFRSIVLAIASKGLLDRALGHIISHELEKELSTAGIHVLSRVDSTPAFNDYFNAVLKCLLDPNVESDIITNLAQDRVIAALDRIESLKPFVLVPHSRSFIENAIAPICYHENAILADRALDLYSSLLNEHSWELQKTEVSTADMPLNFEVVGDQIVILAVPHKDGVNIITLDSQSKVNGSTFESKGEKLTYQPTSAGFYDYCYARISPIGEYEIDQSCPAGRCVVLPAGARKEVIHEMSAFDDKRAISFDTLAEQLQRLSNSGVTAVHLSGAIERAVLHKLTSVTDHTVINRASGGIDGFSRFCERANNLGLRVLIDFTPLVSMHNWSRKYMAYQTLKVDEDGIYKTAKIPGSEIMLLNMRSPKLWELITKEMIELCDKSGVSGFYLGNVDDWDYVYPRDMRELLRVDPDGEQHYFKQNIIEGSVVIESQKTSRCGITSHSTKSSPFLAKMMRTLWAEKPNAFVWIKAETDLQKFVIESGLIPQNNALSKVLQTSIDRCLHTDDLAQITASSSFEQFFKKRKEVAQEGALIITTFGGLTDGPFQMSLEGLSLAIDVLFFLNDVPLINGCLDYAVNVPSAYEISQPKQKAKKWYPPAQKFSDLLKGRAATRARADWILSGDIQILPVAYDSSPLDAILAIARQNPKTNKCALILTGFYTKNLIFEVAVKEIPILQNLSDEAVIEMKPLLGPQGQTTYYAIEEISKDGSSLFLEIDKFSTNVYELDLITPPVPTTVKRILMENIYTRLQRAINFHSIPILSHNRIFNSILDLIEEGTPSDDKVDTLIRDLPNDPELYITFREALFFATRYVREGGFNLCKLTVDEEIENREEIVLKILSQMKADKSISISKFASDIIEANKLGPIMFTAPELGPFSKVGGLSTMVWELAKELVSLGLDIHVVSPYYNVSPKGETNYLNKYGVEYKFKMDVYCPGKTEIGVHYGLVDGVKCWFLHHYSYFSAPYQTGSTSFRLQMLVLMAKAPLELCCQARLIPSLIVTNDWMTGLTAAYARKTFGSVFNGSKFLHIFHNLGVGYAGKLWPSDGNTSALQYIHQLPDELIVDPFDHSFDPSLCTLLASDQWATVSKKYRDELLEGSPYNYFLRGFPEPFAYSNGIRFQERLDAIAKLGMDHFQAKRAIQQKFFGDVDDSKCVFIFVGRIVEQKGVYLIVDTFEELHKKFNGKLQFIVGGQAAADDRAYGLPCTQKMWDLKQRFPKNFWADPSQFFGDGLIGDHGADYMLVPSLFEPSGIVQQESFASGTPVIAFRTGGLADTVFEYNPNNQTGNGFLFWAHRHRDFVMAIERAYNLYCDKEQYSILRQNAFKSVLSTEKVAREWAREFARLFMKIYEPDQNDDHYVPSIPEYAKYEKLAKEENEKEVNETGKEVKKENNEEKVIPAKKDK
ncbi:glycosyl transferase [Tritrichomonas foetus]|uniref:Glycosyl transferase n=1 Tax=Tritrichomonas foetus TaxID=1144522 RepID=A0A1J4J9P3_9EUKA|nr:glycosyl transferase [Tritrichomonas foetus]|eukprot:OHS95914.1 glycosyl transferase [Tritrichomonas foetus]